MDKVSRVMFSLVELTWCVKVISVLSTVNLLLGIYLTLWHPKACVDLFGFPPHKKADTQVADADDDEGGDDAADVDDSTSLEASVVVAVKHLAPEVSPHVKSVISPPNF